MNKFRPQNISKRYIIRQRLRTGRLDVYNWQSRVKWYPVGWGLNKRVIGDQFSRLHYLACHAPGPIRKKWWPAYKSFVARHFGDSSRASVRYLNKHSCHSWL